MKKQNQNLTDAATLRRNAEERQKKLQSKEKLSFSESDMLKLIHELEVHQIELEMQNEELEQSKTKATESSEKYSELYDFAPSGYFTISKEGEILELNLQGAKMLGKERSKLIHAFFILYLSNASKPDFIQFLERTFKSNKKENCTVLISGFEELPVYIYLEGIRDEKNEKCFVTAIDITERKRAQENLKAEKIRAEENEARFKSYTQNSPIAIYTTDVKGNCIYANEKWLSIAGLSMEEARGIGWSQALHPEDKEFVAENWYKSVESGGNWSYEYRFVNKQGKVSWVEGTAKAMLNEKQEIFGYLGSNIDITERKLTEESLAKSTIRFEELVKLLPEVIFEIDKNLNLTYVNQHALDLFGYSPEEISAGLNALDMIVPEDRERAKINFAKRISGEEQGTIEYLALKKDGSIFPILFHASSIIEDGKLIGARGVIVDITEQKKAEEELLKSYNLLNNLTSMVPGVVYQYRLYPDGHSSFPYSSPGIYDIYEVMPEDVKEDASPVFTRIHPDDYDNIVETISESAQKQTLYHDEFRVILPKQGLRWRLCNAKPQLLEDGSTLWHGIVSDITDRKNAEKEILEAKAKSEENTRQLKKAQKTAKVGSWAWHIQENRLWWSDEMYRIFDIDKNTFTGELDKVIEKAIHPEDREKVEESNLSVIKENKPFPVEYRILLKDGFVRYVFAEADEVILDEKGKSKILTGIVKDVTDYKLIQKELILAKEKAEESDRLKSAFLANMSHEIRTPMNGILGFTSLLQEPDLTGEEQQKYIEIIQKSGDRMLNTVNDIIDISKIEAGQMTVTDSEINVAEKLRNLYSFFKPEGEKKGIQFSLKHALSEQELIIQTDSEKLDSILTNLIKNAIKYSDKGAIELGYDILEPHGPDSIVETRCIASLQFYVKDTGIGIRKERQNAIFERFIKADIENRDARQGSGLGLAISKAYVEMLGGKIRVESKPGKGSVFYFTIPYNVKSQEKENNKDVVVEENMDRIKNLNIVIAEDDQASVMLFEIMLQPIAKKVQITSTGKETVELCRNNPDIDLVLMDIQMPEMNGFEATRQIRQFNKKVVIIAQTAFALSGDSEKAIEAGCNDYISKPIKKDVLLSLIQKYFKK